MFLKPKYKFSSARTIRIVKTVLCVSIQRVRIFVFFVFYEYESQAFAFVHEAAQSQKLVYDGLFKLKHELLKCK